VGAPELGFGDKKRVGIYDGSDWRANKWKQLVSSPGYTGYVPPVPRFKMLNIDHTDFIQSTTIRARPDWDPGAFKATCPDGMRLIGLSHGANRGLCTDKGYESDLWLTDRATRVVTDESFVSQDWASWLHKVRVPEGYIRDRILFPREYVVLAPLRHGEARVGP
jgi:endoglucanase